MAENGYKLLRDLRDLILETSLDRALIIINPWNMALP